MAGVLRQRSDFVRCLGSCGPAGDVASGLSHLRTGLDAPRVFTTSGFHKVVLCDLADALGRAGAIAEGLAAVDEVLARSERTEERWCSAELLRTKGTSYCSRLRQTRLAGDRVIARPVYGYAGWGTSETARYSRRPIIRRRRFFAWSSVICHRLQQSPESRFLLRARQVLRS